MHIHGNSMSVSAANLYSVGNRERAAAAQRAADVRKRLSKVSVEGEDLPEETLMLGRWLGANTGQPRDDAESHPDPGRDSDFG